MKTWAYRKLTQDLFSSDFYFFLKRHYEILMKSNYTFADALDDGNNIKMYSQWHMRSGLFLLFSDVTKWKRDTITFLLSNSNPFIIIIYISNNEIIDHDISESQCSLDCFISSNLLKTLHQSLYVLSLLWWGRFAHLCIYTYRLAHPYFYTSRRNQLTRIKLWI